MAQFIRSFSDRLYVHKGDAGGYPREEATFEVRQTGGVRTFRLLVAAYLYYVHLEAAAAIWDATDKPVEIESKLLVETFLN